IKPSFDSFTSTTVFEKAKIRIYYTSNIGNNPIEVWKVDRDWVEHSVTYANKPLRTELFTKDIVINKEQRYIEFDVLEYAQSVVMGDEFNFGFELKATTFGAESSNFFTK